MYVEGKAKIKYAKTAFLNPEAKFSRDVSVAFIAANATRKSRVLDSTAATGIRGMRYYLETKAKDITLLEINRAAYLAARKNIVFNKVKAKVINKSIQEFCNSGPGPFDFIDLDPFGSIAPNLFDLLKVSIDGTLLMVTATDVAVLCGAQKAACLKIYDAKPLHDELCHEAGARILLGYMARLAAQFNFGIEPQLTLSYAHYMRAIVRLRGGASAAGQSINSLGYVHHCRNCLAFTIEKRPISQRQKPSCCKKPNIESAGKLWLGSIQDNDTTSAILAHMRKASAGKDLKMIETISHELDSPFYYSMPTMTKRLGLQAVSPEKVISALARAGYESTRTHFDYSSIKTTASSKEIARVVVKIAGHPS